MLLGLRWRAVASMLLALLVAAVLGVFAVKRLRVASAAKADPGRVGRVERPPHPFASRELRLVRPTAKRTRLLLDERTVETLREHARVESPSFRVLRARCDDQASRDLPAGYQAFIWADALASLSLCHHATGEQDYADAAVRYLKALLDDRFEIGDGKGGPGVVKHDSGYGIRTFGAYAALGYDWLRGARAMTPSLREKVLSRLKAYIDWYEEHGYLRREPFANYFWGYLTTLSFAGLATSGDHPEGGKWLSRSRTLLGRDVLPAFEHDLRGGAWPEGFQYGEYVTLEVALVARAFETATGVPLQDHLPWLAQNVDYHLHALLPSKKSVYGGGTWHRRPAEPSAVGLTGVMIALEGRNPAKAAQARWMVYRDLPPLSRDGAWTAVLATRPGAVATDPRTTAKTSYHVPGTGLSFMRSDWSADAVWAAFQAGPFLTPDHQHKDQGHFEIWRGADALFVDHGGTEGGATLNHNTLLVDDGGRTLTYAPNQGVWGKAVRTTHFEDANGVVVVRGDVADAYAPACAPQGCPERSVEAFTRTMVFVRPSLFVIEDRLRLSKEGDGVKWIAHALARPAASPGGMTATVGSSRVDIQSIAPAGARFTVLREPSGSGKGPHRTNAPFGTVYRIEIDSPRGSVDRRFLQWIQVSEAKGGPPERAASIAGEGVGGAAGSVAGAPVSVLFTDGADRGRAVLPGSTKVVLIGLEPGERYSTHAVAAADSGRCEFSFRRDARGRVVGKGGFVAVPSCGAVAGREIEHEGPRVEATSR